MYTAFSFSILIKYVKTTTNAIITSFMLYDVLFKLTIFNNLCVFITASIVSVFQLNIGQYVLIITLINFFSTLLSVYILHTQKKLSYRAVIAHININTLQDTFKNKIVSYSSPLLGVSILSYIKNYLPTYFLGAMISLELLAVYSIFKKITDFLHKGYSAFLQSLYPKLFQLMKLKSRTVDIFFWMGYGLRIILFLFLYYSYNLIISLYDIKEIESLNFKIFITFLTSFLIIYFGTFHDFIIMSSQKTKSILYTSIITNTVMVPLVLSLFYLFNFEGLLFSIFLQNLITAYGLRFFSVQIEKNKVRDLLLYITTIFCILFLLLN